VYSLSPGGHTNVSEIVSKAKQISSKVSMYRVTGKCAPFTSNGALLVPIDGHYVHDQGRFRANQATTGIPGTTSTQTTSTRRLQWLLQVFCCLIIDMPDTNCCARYHRVLLTSPRRVLRFCEPVADCYGVL